MDEGFGIAVVVIMASTVFGIVACLVGGKPSAFLWGLFFWPFGIVSAAILRLSDDVTLLRQSISQVQHKAEEVKSQRITVNGKTEITLKPTAPQPAASLPHSVFCISCGKEFRIAPTTAPGGTVACPYCKTRQQAS